MDDGINELRAKIDALQMNEPAIQDRYVYDPYDSDSDQEASLLGEGSFGSTHTMKNSDDGRVYAVKLVKIKKTGVGVEQSLLNQLVRLLPRRVQQLQVLDLLEAQTDGRLAPLSEASCPCDAVGWSYSWSLRLFDGDAAGAGRARHRGVLVCASIAPGAAFWAASKRETTAKCVFI